jgi:transcriptional regulator with XRE-family HTH domain
MSANRFGDRLRELRQQAGLTQGQLAEKSGLKLGGITDLEQGINQHPRWDTVLALAEVLGVDCRAFQQAPAKGAKKPGRGRPRKAAVPRTESRRKGRGRSGRG